MPSSSPSSEKPATKLDSSPRPTSFTSKSASASTAPHPRSYLIDLTLALQETTQKLAESSPELHPSFFEFINAIAFQYFKDQNVDIAFIEVGLGGEKDSTNILNPNLSIITSISLDHQEILGPSLTDIAQAKAGIIKSNTSIITGPLPAEAQEVIESKANSLNSPHISVEDAFGTDPSNYPQPAIPGSCQKINAAIALTALDQLKETFPISQDHIKEGLKDVHWPARWQHIPSKTHADLYLDTSHNPEGALHLQTELTSLQNSTSGNISIAFGALGQSRANSLAPSLAPFAHNLLPTTFTHARAATELELLSAIPKNFEGKIIAGSLSDLIRHYQNATPDETFVITGSIYLVGQFMQALDIPVTLT